MKNKTLLAYSGGLDTSVILKWLILQGHEVICYVANVGQEEDFAQAQQKALAIGASEVIIADLREAFVEEFIFPAIQAHALYEGTYLLGTALARPLIAKGLVTEAKKRQISLIAHGATGKGNDQVRFELAIHQLMPEAQIVAPWRDPLFLSQFQGRGDLIAFAQQEEIPITSTLKKPYSIDANLMHISYEGGKLEQLDFSPSPDMYQWTKSPEAAQDTVTKIAITFAEGCPIKLLDGDTTIEGSLPLFQHLNKVAAENGIGRIDIVENRSTGMKSRGVYETPAGTVLLKAHHDLETLVLDREVFHFKETLGPKIAKLIYDGLWFSPEMECLMGAIEQTQHVVTGTIHLSLYKGNVWIDRRESKQALYNETLASMESSKGYDPQDMSGYLRIQALRLNVHSERCQKPC